MPANTRLFYGAFIALLMSAPVQASNPQVTLALEEVTCRQAVEAISKATGLPFELREPNVAPGTPLPPQYARLQQRRNFTWRNLRLAAILRQLSAEYGVRINRYSNVYSVSPETGPPVVAVPPKNFVEKVGVRIIPSYVSVSSHRSQNLENGDAPEQNSSVSIRLKVRWPEGEPDSILGFDNVVARDDQGNVLLWNAPAIGIRRPTVGSGLPDEWDGTLSLNDPHPRATKLQWLEGDLVVYGIFKPVTLEIPFTGKERTGTRRLGAVEAAITSYEQRPPTPGSPTSGSLLVKARVLLPQGDRSLGPAFGYSPTPVLVGASGKQYFSRGGRRSGSTQDGNAVHEMDAEFAPIEEPVAKAVFALVERGEPKKLFSFRLNELPFPSQATFVPRTQPRPRPTPGTAKPEVPFHQPGGGTLVFRTEVAGAPVGEGTLTIGLAQKQGAEWGPVRWQDLPIDKSGMSRLPDVAPGVYRLLRIYRVPTVRSLGAEGQWQNGEIQVTLVARQNTTVAPLHWTSKPLPAGTAKE